MCREQPIHIQRSGRSQQTESDNPPPSALAEEETVGVPSLSFCCRIELKMRSPVSALLRDNRITSTWGWAGSCLHKIQDTLAQPE
jgi:hypothetical protein